MAVIRATTTLGPVGSINSHDSPPTITTPTVVAGDLLMVAVFFAQGTGNTTLFTPAGMTMVTIPGTSTNRLGALYVAKVVNPADWTAGIILKSGNTATRIAAVAWSLQPQGTEYFNVTDINTSGPDWNGSTMTTDTFPAGATGNLFIGISMSNKAASATYTTHSAAGGGTAIAQARALAGASGSQSDSTVSAWIGGTGVSFNIVQANGQAYTVGLTVRVPSVVIGLPVKKGDGTAAHASFLNASVVRKAPASIRQFHPGFQSVSQMEAVHGATWAHRGGSINWPEMSEYSYDRAVMRRYGALEFSARRSSDGVWFGLHDDTLARTTIDPALTASVSTMTWAAIQAKLNNLNAAGFPRPYYLLDDFLAKYTNHVLLIENKPATQNVSEFLPKMAAIPNATSRIVIKIDGSYNLARFQEAKAAGFKVAGYWYASSYDTTLPSRVPYSDYVGMEYVASQAIWDAVIAYGKKTWAHIAATQANYTTAMSKGADFVQCSGVNVIAPVR